ncbi:MAG: TVP38/TMEM64 family protein [Alphaproteobacteria bacterium]|nr:MAG: TVP38/TMEM64 family protein [Alphaproteobacteria bacterium]
MSNLPAADPEGKASRVKRFLPLLVIVAALAAFFALGLDDYFSQSALQENHAALKAFAARWGLLAVALFIVIYAAAVSISFPGASLLTIFAGFMFGTLVGGTAVVIGATLGATIIFLIARTALGQSLREKAGSSLQKFEAGFKQGELSYMLILRLVPLFPFWLVNLAPAFLGVSTRNYVIATFIGIMPATYVFASAGDVGSKAIERGEDLTLTGLLSDPKVLFLIGGLIVLALIPVIYKKVTGNKGARA